MRILPAAILALSVCTLALADGPGDNAFDKVRPVPPPGVKISDDVRKELTEGVATLKAEIGKLEKSISVGNKSLLPDVQIYLNAVYYALKYDEFLINAPNISKTGKDGSKKPREQVEKETAEAVARSTKGQVESARRALKAGMDRAAELAAGKPSWAEAKGSVPRGYRSKIDDSVQPYVLWIPEGYDPKRAKPYRLDFWCHGRGETLSELNFLNTGKPPFMPADTIVCQLYGRFCNANKFAGEVDLLEALDDIKKKYRIDEDRVVIRGFSMGGAACWQFAVHYPSLFCCAAPGAGFSETPDFLKVFQNEVVKPTPTEQKLWHWYNATDYALNLYNLPTVAYSGEIDGQKQAADMMVAALDKEGMKIPHIIGPKTGHAYHKDSIPFINKFVDEAAARGRPATPETFKFETYTLRYDRSYWVRIEGMEEHWENARIEAIREGNLTVTTKNVAAFRVELTEAQARAASDTARIDGQILPLKIDGSGGASFWKDGRDWKVAERPANRVLRKVHGLQGPIDDAFMDHFLFVRPTGKSSNEAVSKWVDTEMNRAIVQWRKVFRGEVLIKDDKDVSGADIAESNLVLWGDPRSNSLYAKINDKLPIQPKPEKPNEVPLLIYPNPLNPKKYVVTNSGFTFREYDALNNARQVPKLPDWAIVDITTPPDARYPGKVVDAGFFDDVWKVK